jgi:hypothetical protein
MLFPGSLSIPQQLLKSWYIFAFQPPGIAEFGFSALGGQLVRQVFTIDPDTAWTRGNWTRVLGKNTKNGTCLHKCPRSLGK